MSKRNQKVIETELSITLRELRTENSLSVRKLAELMNISKSRVHQMESGRENISSEYIQKFLSAIDYSYEEWQIKLGTNKNNRNELREKCHNIIDKIDSEKLNWLYELVFKYHLS